MKISSLFFSFLFLFCTSVSIESKRSVFRRIDPRKPIIATFSQKEPHKKQYYSDWYYYKNPMFTAFDDQEFFQHLVQESSMRAITEHRCTLSYQELNSMLEELVSEVKNEHKTYAHFVSLQDKNFNRKKKCGLLVLKFKNFPFVIKLFMENPETVVNPYCKGFENRIFHIMGHGTNRHIAGLSRIPNMKRLQKEISSCSDWNIILPRKWFWLPQEPEWITIEGTNIGQQKTISTTIPGIYAIIADELKKNPELDEVPFSEKNRIIMDFCNKMHMIIDPHATNFIIQKDNTTGKISIVLVDTEYFPGLVGLLEQQFSNHIEWYCSLSVKALKDLFVTSKDEHLKRIMA